VRPAGDAAPDAAADAAPDADDAPAADAAPDADVAPDADAAPDADDETALDAALLAAAYLAAGGVGTLVVRGATAAQRAELGAHGPDTVLLAEPALDEDGLDRSVEVDVPARPVWWPAAEGAGCALAFWRGGLAATRWMADIANK
jgi:hypothetical protein